MNQWVLNFPWFMYDSTEYDEVLLFDQFKSQLPIYGAVLFQDNNVAILRAPQNGIGFGSYYSCKVLEIGEEELKVDLTRLLQEQIIWVPKIYVCVFGQNIETYSKRVTAALVRRNQCVALMRYYSSLSCMPINQRITTSMTETQYEKIRLKAVSMKKLKSLEPAVAEEQIIEAKHEFEMIMDKIL